MYSKARKKVALDASLHVASLVRFVSTDGSKL